jgi:hypothetical protein
VVEQVEVRQARQLCAVVDLERDAAALAVDPSLSVAPMK